MKHVHDDGGREAAGYKGAANDCVTRAVAIAARLPYQQVYDALSAGCRAQRVTRRRKASARDGVNTQREWFRAYMRGLGFTWTPLLTVGSSDRVRFTDGQLPMGRLVVSVRKHYTAVIDGAVHDTFDPQDSAWGPDYRRVVSGYWKLKE